MKYALLFLDKINHPALQILVETFQLLSSYIFFICNDVVEEVN